MDVKQILSEVVNIHNQAFEVNVHGDDVLRMAKIIQDCRSLVCSLSSLMEEETKGSDDIGEISGDK